MSIRKIVVVAVLGIILLLSSVLIIQAGLPSLSGGVANILGDTPIQEQDDNRDRGNSRPEMQQRLDGDDANIGSDPPAQDEDEPDNDDTPPETQQHPVANAIAQEFNVDYEEIISRHQAGYGFGEIAKSYALANELGMSPEEILPKAREVGWGKLLKDNGLHPGAAGRGHNLGAIMSGQKGQGNRPEHAGPPGGDGPPGQRKRAD